MAGITGNGATLTFGSAVGRLTSISISSSGTAIDCTSMDDANAVYVAGVPDSGEVTAEVNYSPTVFNALEVDRTAKTARSVVIVFSDGSDWAVSGFITKLDATSPKDGVVTASVTFKLTAAITHSAT
jgi:hypothetical protein